MALNLVSTVVEFLQQHPDQKFTAREIAHWIVETYPDECRQKQKRSTATVIPLDNETALLYSLPFKMQNFSGRIKGFRQGKLLTAWLFSRRNNLMQHKSF